MSSPVKEASLGNYPFFFRQGTRRNRESMRPALDFHQWKQTTGSGSPWLSSSIGGTRSLLAHTAGSLFPTGTPTQQSTNIEVERASASVCLQGWSSSKEFVDSMELLIRFVQTATGEVVAVRKSSMTEMSCKTRC